MKKVTSAYPKELIEVICKAYPGYWPLTREQTCYFLLRKVGAGDSEPVSFRDAMGPSFPRGSPQRVQNRNAALNTTTGQTQGTSSYGWTMPH